MNRLNTIFKLALLVGLVLISSTWTIAQTTGPAQYVQFFVADPTGGVCGNGGIGMDAAGVVYSCQSGTWAAVTGGGGGLTINTTTITGGTNTKVLYNNSGVVGEYTVSGSGNVAMTTSPVFTTPNLGTPSAAILTNATGLPISTGVSGLGANVATFLATPSSANLRAALTDETGTGAAVFENANATLGNIIVSGCTGCGGGISYANMRGAQRVRVATTTAGTLATSFENGDVIDGITLVTGMRILIKDQATGGENGIYTVNASGAPTRATDFDEDTEILNGVTIGVSSGTVNQQRVFITRSSSGTEPVVVGTTVVNFFDQRLPTLTDGVNFLIKYDASFTNTVQIKNSTDSGSVGLQAASIYARGTLGGESTSSSCLSMGANGDTNPVLRVSCNTANVVTGLNIIGNASGAGVYLSALGGTNESIRLSPKGTGVVELRNGTNIQELDIYNTDDGAGNTELAKLRWSANILLLETTKTGTGATRNMTITPNGSLLGLGASGAISWYATSTQLAAAANGSTIIFGALSDLGLARQAAATLRVTNGSTGVGAIGFSLPTLTKTADYTVLNTETGYAFDNSGAAGTVVFTLPTPAAGLNYRFCRVANQTVTLDIAGAVTIQIGASVTTGGGNVTLDAVGSCATIWAVSTTQWFGHLSGTGTFN